MLKVEKHWLYLDKGEKKLMPPQKKITANTTNQKMNDLNEFQV